MTTVRLIDHRPQILRLHALGLSPAAIARALPTSPAAVHRALAALRYEDEVHSRGEALLLAAERGLLTAEDAACLHRARVDVRVCALLRLVGELQEARRLLATADARIEVLKARVETLRQTPPAAPNLTLARLEHEWHREVDTRIYRCEGCGTRTYEPRSVQAGCEELRAAAAVKRRRRVAGGNS